MVRKFPNLSQAYPTGNLCSNPQLQECIFYESKEICGEHKWTGLQ